jgi:hypothetical protein
MPISIRRLLVTSTVLTVLVALAAVTLDTSGLILVTIILLVCVAVVEFLIIRQRQR